MARTGSERIDLVVGAAEAHAFPVVAFARDTLGVRRHLCGEARVRGDSVVFMLGAGDSSFSYHARRQDDELVGVVTEAGTQRSLIFRSSRPASLPPCASAGLNPSEKRTPRLVPHLGTVMASRLVGLEGRPVGFLYREAPDGPHDSGWRVFSGDEDQTFADDPQNFALYDAETIARIDSAIVPLLVRNAPVAFERSYPGGPFVEVADYEFRPADE